jgi:SPRY domain-containing SOCS box protein 3
MTILGSSSIGINKFQSSSILGSILQKPIQRKPVNKSNALRHINSERLQNSIELVNTKKTNFSKKEHYIPIKSGYHKIDWEWSESSESTIFSNDKKSVVFHAECESCFETDAIRGNKPLKRNAYTYWEVNILNENLNGTSIQIGIGNKNANLSTIGYLNLLGSDRNSYGLTHNGQLWHRNETTKFCGSWNESDSVIGCLFNGYNGTLSYYKNGLCLGVAFKNIDMSEYLYPMVSSTIAQSGFRLGFVCETFPCLRDLCRKSIVERKISTLNENLPRNVLSFLKN